MSSPPGHTAPLGQSTQPLPEPHPQLVVGSQHTPRAESVNNLTPTSPSAAKRQGTNVCVAVGDGDVEPLPKPDALGEALADTVAAVLCETVTELVTLGDGDNDGDELAEGEGETLPVLVPDGKDADCSELTLGDTDEDAEYEGDEDPEGEGVSCGVRVENWVAERIGLLVANWLVENRVERDASPDAD